MRIRISSSNIMNSLLVIQGRKHTKQPKPHIVSSSESYLGESVISFSPVRLQSGCID